tara:strand:+ start:16 stop:858 length:843 start_codon:yes stop_codon:yes gene_type:complete
MIIFLTGGTGFVGKRFLKLASERGHFVYAVSRKKKHKNNNNIKWLKGELDDDWKKFIKKSDVIVHLAAKGVRSNSNKDSYEVIDFNVRKSLNLILYALKNNCRNFVIASTSSEYSNNGLCNNEKLSIKSKREFSNLYSLSKIVFTDIIKKISRVTNSNFRIMRIFPTYGIGEYKDRLFPKIKRLAKKGKNMIIENPYEYRDFTDVDYVAKVLLDACKFNKKRKFEIFHVSSNKPISIKEFSEKIWKKYKATGKLIFKNQNKKYRRHVSSSQSIWKLTNEQ